MKSMRWLAFVLCLALVACGKNDGTDNTAEATGLDSLTGKAKDAMKKAEDTVGKLPSTEDLKKAFDENFSVDKFKGMIEGFDGEALKKIGQDLWDKLQSEEGVLAGLQKQLSSLDVTKSSAVKTKIEESRELIESLKEKFEVVKTKLSEMGMDPSKLFK